MLRKIRKLTGFVRRERRLVGELRPGVGIRRALAARARVNLELDANESRARIDATLGDALARMAAHDQTFVRHAEALASLPLMGRALEGLAARIDRLDGLTEGVGSAGSPVAPTAPPPATTEEGVSTLVPGPRRARPQPSFAQRDGRLRILGVNDMFPLISETYVREELNSLVQFGADIAWYRRAPGPAPMPVPEPVFDDFEQALEIVQPDLAMVHWLTTANVSVPLFERHELPFGVRAHSFDFDRDLLRKLQSHPLCIGAWVYPSAEFTTPGAHSLTPIFASEESLPPPAAIRDKVVSISAGLPKKDWPLLLDAFDQIQMGDRRVIVGVTIDFEDNPSELVRACEQLGNPPLVQLNMVREDVLALLSRTAVSIYTLHPDARFGMPMSIVDALCAGCSVVVPDRPEALEFAGPDARPYRTAEDIARQVHEVLAGGPGVRAEWERNMEYARKRFCDPETPVRFNEELREGLTRVRAP
jgi:glycosyltransferase involved in cell wall biosynthesis